MKICQLALSASILQTSILYFFLWNYGKQTPGEVLKVPSLPFSLKSIPPLTRRRSFVKVCQSFMLDIQRYERHQTIVRFPVHDAMARLIQLGLAKRADGESEAGDEACVLILFASSQDKTGIQWTMMHTMWLPRQTKPSWFWASTGLTSLRPLICLHGRPFLTPALLLHLSTRRRSICAASVHILNRSLFTCRCFFTVSPLYLALGRLQENAHELSADCALISSS